MFLTKTFINHPKNHEKYGLNILNEVIANKPTLICFLASMLYYQHFLRYSAII